MAPKVDIGWEFGMPIGDNRKTIQCKFCGKVITGGITRLKQHIAHVAGNVETCSKAPKEISLMLRKQLRDSKSERNAIKKKKEIAINAIQKSMHALDSDSDSEDEDRFNRYGTNEDLRSSNPEDHNIAVSGQSHYKKKDGEGSSRLSKGKEIISRDNDESDEDDGSDDSNDGNNEGSAGKHQDDDQGHQDNQHDTGMTWAQGKENYYATQDTDHGYRPGIEEQRRYLASLSEFSSADDNEYSREFSHSYMGVDEQIKSLGLGGKHQFHGDYHRRDEALLNPYPGGQFNTDSYPQPFARDQFPQRDPEREYIDDFVPSRHSSWY